MNDCYDKVSPNQKWRSKFFVVLRPALYIHFSKEDLNNPLYMPKESRFLEKAIQYRQSFISCN